MGARAVSSGIIAFGMVNIPYRLYTACSSEQISFNLLCPEHKCKVKQFYKCPVDGKIIERGDMIKGYEYAKDHFVVFADEELKSIRGENTNVIDINEFVPLSTFDFIQVEKSYYIGADKGGDKALILLAQSMEKKGLVAVGKWASRGKDQLVVIRPYQGGLAMHQLFYHNEVREFIGTPANIEVDDRTRKLAEGLIDTLTSEAFNPKAYHDEYAQRAHEAVEAKHAGNEIEVSPGIAPATVADLFDSLKKSLEDVKNKKKAGGFDSSKTVIGESPAQRAQSKERKKAAKKKRPAKKKSPAKKKRAKKKAG